MSNLKYLSEEDLVKEKFFREKELKHHSQKVSGLKEQIKWINFYLERRRTKKV